MAAFKASSSQAGRQAAGRVALDYYAYAVCRAYYCCLCPTPLRACDLSATFNGLMPAFYVLQACRHPSAAPLLSRLGTLPPACDLCNISVSAFCTCRKVVFPLVCNALFTSFPFSLDVCQLHACVCVGVFVFILICLFPCIFRKALVKCCDSNADQKTWQKCISIFTRFSKSYIKYLVYPTLRSRHNRIYIVCYRFIYVFSRCQSGLI